MWVALGGRLSQKRKNQKQMTGSISGREEEKEDGKKKGEGEKIT